MPKRMHRYRLDAVTHVGQGAPDDHAHGVVEIGLPHLGFDIHRNQNRRRFFLWHFLGFLSRFPKQGGLNQANVSRPFERKVFTASKADLHPRSAARRSASRAPREAPRAAHVVSKRRPRSAAGPAFASPPREVASTNPRKRGSFANESVHHRAAKAPESRLIVVFASPTKQHAQISRSATSRAFSSMRSRRSSLRCPSAW